MDMDTRLSIANQCRSSRFRLLALLGVVTTALLPLMPAQAAEPVQFNRDIRPLLSDNCMACHGPAEQKAKLRLDLRDIAIKVSKDGTAAIVPGKPEASELVARIMATDADDIMPPPDSHKTLKAEQKALLKQWIAEGAIYQKHWSFEPPVKAPLPAVNARGTALSNPIDPFILDRLLKEKLSMSKEADPSTLIRRAAFTLTGLPPTLAEINQYLADKSGKAYENMVDRYMASTRFGEEMARHWLDVARYGDTHGLHLDNERQMWAYRDWVIKAFNTNMPFDQFTIEQVAGDLLPNATADQLTATGFLRCNVTTGEGGSINDEWIFRNTVDRTNTVVQTWMGLTAGCAVCHDHKFDPISAKEYYQFYAFFVSAADPALDGNALLTAPSVRLPTEESTKKLAELEVQIADKQKSLDEAAAKLAYVDPATIEPRPPVTEFETVWFDDDIPQGSRISASPGHATLYVTADNGKVHSGKRALKRTHDGLTQDVIEGVTSIEVPLDGNIFVHVFIDPSDVPKSVMIQFHTSGWNHRAVWGDYNAIEWGAANTTQRVNMGALPETGKWVKLEISAEKIGLKPGDKITGFAFTQFAGTVFWDKAGFSGTSDPASDVRRSLFAWWTQHKGKDVPAAPADIKAIAKAGPDGKHNEEQQKKLRDYYLQHVCIDTQPTLAPLLSEVAALRKQQADVDKSIPGTFIFRDLPQPREATIMLRGDYTKKGEKVEPGTLAILPPLNKEDSTKPASRLDLARWMVSPQHPLTARVAVNRLWQQFYGTGLVKSSDDFGSQGQVPSHPELIDWLAVDFRESAWDVKRMVRLMVTSATFRQDSRVSPEIIQHDPENRLFARGPRFRLDAEQIRDNALFVSGLMNHDMGGRGSMPYQPPNIWEPVGFTGSNTRDYKQEKGEALYRRSIYVFLKRTAPPPFMVNFDAPAREAFCAQRERSNSPLQALQLMNDVQHFEAARALAQRMMTQGGKTVQERITFAYQTVLSRKPDAVELAIVSETLASHLKKYEANVDAAKKVIANGESKAPPELPVSELAANTMIANLILNLDETLNRN